MPHGFWGCHFAKGGAVIPREFYSGVPNSTGCHILCDTGNSLWISKGIYTNSHNMTHTSF